ncbi:MAG: hypothetical protein CVV03_12140 [Firmicutes bacterium HGW-Firmicutes-8]|nr:MAG: hypothetical protein CVV03_12140 [Firmicutes bacterium HGW-Firmicutes-8]
MNIVSHLRLLITVTSAWVVFVIVGLPDYYQGWPFRRLLYFCILVYFLVGFLIFLMMRKYKSYLLGRALWMAFYISVPLMIYDYIYVYLIRQEPFDLLNRFWYLAVFYIVPWFQAPLIYFFMKSGQLRKKSWIILSLFSFISAAFLYYWWGRFESGFFNYMSTDPETNLSMLQSALRLSVFGTFISVGILSIVRLLRRPLLDSRRWGRK